MSNFYVLQNARIDCPNNNFQHITVPNCYIILNGNGLYQLNHDLYQSLFNIQFNSMMNFFVFCFPNQLIPLVFSLFLTFVTFVTFNCH